MVIVAILLGSLFTGPAAVGREPQESRKELQDARKVVVLIVDNTGISDFRNNDLPNFGKVIDAGGIGLMNTRVGSLTSHNRASAYLTIGMGVRTFLEETGITAVNGEKTKSPLPQISLKEADKIKNLMKQDYPNYVFGKIGQMARQNGLKTALVGNADTDKPHRESALLAVDSSGIIEMGSVDSDLLQKDSQSAWGHRTDVERLMADSLEAVAENDIVFIDFGDTARVHEAEAAGIIGDGIYIKMKASAMRRADYFLGLLLQSLDMEETVLIIISPAPSASEVSSGNRTLAPVIVYDRTGTRGVLTSDTTRCSGLVANIDLGPTIFGTLGLEVSGLGFVGERITVVPDQANYSTVSDSLTRYIHVNRSRYIVHGLYVTLLTVTLAGLYLSKFRGRNLLPLRTLRALAVMVLALPVSSFVVASLLAGELILTFFYIDVVLIAAVTLLTGIMFSRNRDLALKAFGWLSLATALFLLSDLLMRWQNLPNTPLGFDNVFMGGRYYGINNDSMGILLGSVVFAMFYFFDRLNTGRYLRIVIAFVVMGLVVISQTPVYGANVGGTIAAMTTGIISLMVLVSRQPLRRGRILATITVVFIIELVIAYLDYLFGGQTHAGRVLGALISQGMSDKFLEVLFSKLTLFAVMLVVPPWNLLLAAQFFFYYKVRKHACDGLMEIRNRLPVLTYSFEVIFYGGLVAFLFNDTGIIATALMFTYLTVPLGVMLDGENASGTG